MVISTIVVGQNYYRYGQYLEYNLIRSLTFNLFCYCLFLGTLPLIASIHKYLANTPLMFRVILHGLAAAFIIIGYAYLLGALLYLIGFISQPWHPNFMTKYFLNMALVHGLVYIVFVLNMPKTLVSGYQRFLEVRFKSSRIQCPVDEIIWIEAMDHYVRLHTSNRFYLKKTSMLNLERELDPNKFRRVHRSYMINLDYVKHLEERPSRAIIQLQNGVEVSIGGTYMQQIKQLLGSFTND